MSGSYMPYMSRSNPGPSIKPGSISHRAKAVRNVDMSIEVAGEMSYVLKGWCRVLGPLPVESKVMTLFGNLWQIRVLPCGDQLVHDSNSVGIFLVNKSDRPVCASYTITLKNQRRGRDKTWCDPDGEVQFGTPDTGDDYWGCDDFISRDELEDAEAGFLVNDCLVICVQVTARNKDVLGAITRITASASEIGDQTSESPLEAASDELQELSTIMRQKVRLLSEDAILQDELIRVRLGRTRADRP